MNSIDDLRDTLAHEADGLLDDRLLERSGAVRGRVRGVRRRRAAVTAAVVVVLVGAGGSVLALHSGPPVRVAPAGTPDQVAGQTVPRQVTVTGFPYAYSSGIQLPVNGARSTSLRLPSDSGDRVVSLAVEGLGSGTATLYADGSPVARSTAASQLTVPVTLASQPTRLQVRLDGADAGAQAGVAVYDSTGQLPAGVTDGTAVFRSQSPGQRLLTAGFTSAGGSAETLSFHGRLSEIHFADYCRADPSIWVSIDVDGDGPVSSSCQSDPGVDATGSALPTFQDDTSPARYHTVRVWLTRGAGGPTITVPGAVAGLGIYRVTSPARVLGTEIERTLEYDGRVWILDHVTVGTPESTTPLDLQLPTGSQDLLIGLESGRGAAVIDATSPTVQDSSPIASGADNEAAGIGGGPVGELFSGATYHVRVSSGDGKPLARTALVVYRPVD